MVGGFFFGAFGVWGGTSNFCWFLSFFLSFLIFFSNFFFLISSNSEMKGGKKRKEVGRGGLGFLTCPGSRCPGYSRKEQKGRRGGGGWVERFGEVIGAFLL